MTRTQILILAAMVVIVSSHFAFVYNFESLHAAVAVGITDIALFCFSAFIGYTTQDD